MARPCEYCGAAFHPPSRDAVVKALRGGPKTTNELMWAVRVRHNFHHGQLYGTIARLVRDGAVEAFQWSAQHPDSKQHRAWILTGD